MIDMKRPNMGLRKRGGACHRRKRPSVWPYLGSLANTGPRRRAGRRRNRGRVGQDEETRQTVVSAFHVLLLFPLSSFLMPRILCI